MGKIIVTGVGKSGIIAKKIDSTLSSTGSPSQFIHSTEASHGDLGMIDKKDVILAFTFSGKTIELNDIFIYSKEKKIPLIIITGKANSKLRNISSTYTYSTNHDYNNIRADLQPSYWYRFGLQESPIDGSGALYNPSLIGSSIVGSSLHKYTKDFRTSTNINIIQSVNTSLEFRYATSLSKSSTASTTAGLVAGGTPVTGVCEEWTVAAAAETIAFD